MANAAVKIGREEFVTMVRDSIIKAGAVIVDREALETVCSYGPYPATAAERRAFDSLRADLDAQSLPVQ